MSHYENPSFPSNPSANIAPNASPAAYAKAYNAAPVAGAYPAVHGAYPAAQPVGVGHGYFTTTGAILVLFILLVIISRAMIL